MMIESRKLLASLAIFFAVSSPIISPSAQASEDRLETLAVDDLRSCLSSSDDPTIALYYLIDASNSMVTSDPAFVRDDIVGSSLQRLSALESGVNPVKIRYSVGFFGDDFHAGSPWNDYQASSPSEVTKLIAEEGTTPGTNWIAGLAAARSELQSQSGACKAMVWVTDGSIRMYNSSNQFDQVLTDSALADLCGNRAIVDQTGRSERFPNGIFHEIRTSGISVFGIYLDNKDASEDSHAASRMQSLVEATSPGGVSCGTGSVTGEQTHGKFIRASGTDVLAFEIELLVGSFLGGAPGEIGDDGTFEIGRGVSRFRISSDIELASIVDPNGLQLINDDSRVQHFPGVNDIEVTVKSTSDYGLWTAGTAAARPRVVVRFGDITLGLDELNNVVSGENGDNSSVTFTAATEHPDLAKLSDYTFNWAVTTTYPDGKVDTIASGDQSTVLEGANVIDGFVINPSYLDVGFDVIFSNVASIDGDALENSVARKSKHLPPPGQYPTVIANSEIRNPVDIGTKGTIPITIKGPSESDSGKVCFTENLVDQVESTTFISASQFNWGLADENGNPFPKSCVTVARGEIRTATLSAGYVDAAQDAAASSFSARVPFELTSSSGNGTIEYQVMADFDTSNNKDLAALLLVQALLFIVGFSLPLALIGFFRARTARVIVGSMVNAVSSDVKYITRTGTLAYSDQKSNGAEVTLTSIMKSTLDILNVEPISKPVATYAPLNRGLLAGRYRRLNPFMESWVEYIAPEGFIAVTSSFENSNRNLHDPEFNLGRKVRVGAAVRNLKLLIVNDADISATDMSDDFTIPAVLLIFSSPTPDNPEAFDKDLQKLLEVDHGPELRRIKKAKEDLARTVESSSISKGKRKDSVETVASEEGSSTKPTDSRDIYGDTVAPPTGSSSTKSVNYDEPGSPYASDDKSDGGFEIKYD